MCVHPKLYDYVLHGSYTIGKDYQGLSIILIPCASRITIFDGSVIGGDDSCAWDQQEVRDYLGDAFYIKVYHS